MKASLFLFGIMILTLTSCQSGTNPSDENNVESTTEGAEMVESTPIEEWKPEVTYLNSDDETFDYIAYDALLGTEPFALFFYASWCPTCQLMEEEILSNSKNFPEGAIILNAKFDTATEWKEKYGIKSQSTIVMINKDGTVEEILIAPSFSELKESFEKLLNPNS